MRASQTNLDVALPILSTDVLSTLLTFEFAVYVGVFSLAALGCFVALVRVRLITDADVRRGLAALLLMSGGWATTHVGYLAAPTPSTQHVFYVVGLVFGFASIGSWLYFCSAYTGRSLHRNRVVRRVAVLVFLGIVAVKLTNPIHGLYYSTAIVSEPFSHLLVSHEPLHWVIMGFAYALAFVGFFMLFELFLSVDSDVSPLVVLVGITGLPVIMDIAGFLSPSVLEITYSPLGVSVFAIGTTFVYLESFQTMTYVGTHDEPLILLDEDDRIRDFNRAARELFPALEDAHGHSLSAVLPGVSRTLTDSESLHRHQRDGDVRYYHLTTTPFARGGSTLSRKVLFSDVTERMERERELTQARERLAVALETSHSGVWEWDPNTDEVHWHESCERLFGLDPGTFEETYDAFRKRVHEEDIDQLESTIEDAVSSYDPFEDEFRIRHADGETRWLKTRAEFVVTDESPRYIGVAMDITKLKEQEQKFWEEHAFLENTLETIPDVFYAFDEAGNLILHNDRLEAVTGYTADELQQLKPWDFLPAGQRENAQDVFRTILETGETTQVEARLLTKDDETIPYEFSGTPYRGPDGTIEGFIGIGRNITHRLEYEHRLAGLHETTRELMEAKDAETVGEIVCTVVEELLGLSAAGVAQYDDQVGGVVPLELTDGLVDLFGGEPTVFPDDSLPERILERGEELVAQDVSELELPELDADDIPERSQFAMPLDDRTVFGFTDETPGPIDIQTLELVRILGEQTAAALERIEREAEIRMKTRALDSAPVGITISDPSKEDNPLIYVNDHYTEITGYSETEATGRNCRYLQGEKTASEPVAEMRTAIDDDRPVSVELLNYRSDGTEFWNNVKIAPVYDEDGTVTNYVGFQQDVTERVERETELRETKRKLEAVLDTISAAVFMKDTESRYLLMNQGCRELLGVGDETDVEGLTDDELFPSDVAAQFREDDRNVFEREETIEVEEEVPTPEGTKPHLTRKSPVYDDSGELYGLCAVSTDVSELKQRERELEQFAYAASHDLREPLRVVSNYLQLLERRHGDALDDDAIEYIEYAVDAAERMKALIDGLLTYSRIDRRGSAFEPTDLNDVLSAARSNLEIAIERSDTTIVAADLPTVHGDADQLVTVFQNVLDNAITYSGDEPPAIEVGVDERSDAWVVTVADEGIGMDPERTDRAFEIFERLHDDGTDGTGLGLALCEKILDRHGGSISIDAEPDAGTNVHLLFPKHDV